MDKKVKSPYGKIFMALMILLLAAGFIAPFTNNYVNNASYSTDRDEDQQLSIIMENVVMRLVKQGDITLSKELTSDFVEEKMTSYMGSIPEINQAGCYFCMNVTNGKVNVRKEKEINEIIINNVKGD